MYLKYLSNVLNLFARKSSETVYSGHVVKIEVTFSLLLVLVCQFSGPLSPGDANAGWEQSLTKGTNGAFVFLFIE